MYICSLAVPLTPLYSLNPEPIVGGATGVRDWLVPQPPGLWLLALRHRRQHPDAESTVSRTFCRHRGELFVSFTEI